MKSIQFDVKTGANIKINSILIPTLAHKSMPYLINPDRSIPWNDLPELPISEELYRNIDVYEALSNAKAALGRSIAIPNQAMLINTISLQEQRHPALSRISSRPTMSSIKHSVSSAVMK